MARPAAKSRGAAKTAPARKQAVAKAAKSTKKTTPAKNATKVVKKVATRAKATTKTNKKAKPVKKSPKSVKKAVKPVKVVPVPAQATETNNEEPQCSVCMDDLSSKRALQFLPCAHSFHRTCAIEWLETRIRKSDQICPLCRQKVEKIKENRKTVKNSHIALGAEQPCATNMELLKRLNGAKGSTYDFVLSLETKYSMEIEAICTQRKAAVENGMGEDYIEDFGKELKKLRKRARFLNKIRQQDLPTDEDAIEMSVFNALMRGPYLNDYSILDFADLLSRETSQSIREYLRAADNTDAEDETPFFFKVEEGVHERT